MYLGLLSAPTPISPPDAAPAVAAQSHLHQLHTRVTPRIQERKLSCPEALLTLPTLTFDTGPQPRAHASSL